MFVYRVYLVENKRTFLYFFTLLCLYHRNSYSTWVPSNSRRADHPAKFPAFSATRNSLGNFLPDKVLACSDSSLPISPSVYSSRISRDWIANRLLRTSRQMKHRIETNNDPAWILNVTIGGHRGEIRPTSYILRSCRPNSKLKWIIFIRRLNQLRWET